ncbi:hypothetical protein KQI88_01100 [Alkaliphilus sp. MSJ-5]|uniref:Uncharacterized protein n=1 Tax=Alkaliphilus flagellatus TaxID=2841507 RepID=A0ABS6G055_9FIRM|nr:hypothetical protein [Alkaliphilus flagellatus]MBU5675013.1 hypothetical protein [Alkaliphilus flagellatus]
MKNLMKKYVSIIFAVVMICSNSVLAFASNVDNLYITENNHQYGSRTREFLLNIDVDNLIIQDSNGGPVNTALYEKITGKLLEADYDVVIDLVFQHNVSLLVEVKEDSLMPMSVGSTVNFERLTSHLKYSTKGDYRQEWITIMRGKYQENDNGTLTALGSPNLSIEAFWGAGWAVSMSNVQTGYSYSNGNKAINYYGSYTLNATLWDLGLPLLQRSYGHISVTHTIA